MLTPLQRQSLPSTNLNASSFSPSTGNRSTPSISPFVIPETIPSDPESTGLKLVADLNNSNKPTRLHHMKLLSTTLSKKKFAHLSTHSTTDVEPSSFAKAQSLPMWQQAMQNEIDALHKNNTWTLVPPPLNANVVGNRWLYKIKRHADGSIERYKARLVAKGFTQEYGFDYTETFSPVVKPITIRTLLSIVVSGGWDISQLDISNAFLNGDLQETVYMVQPQGFIDPHRPHYVCRLNKSLYGLRQSPRTWSQRLGTYLLTLGFKKSTADPSLFIYRTKSCVCFVLVYVDDVIITCSSSTLIQEFIHQLSKEFDLRNLGPLHYFLGIQVLKHSSGIILTQQKYLLDTLISANMHESKPWSTPMVSGSVASRFSGTPLSASEASQYRQLCGRLQYATLTRPDISFAVNKLCQYMHCPTDLHAQSLKRVLRYIKGTLHYGLLIKKCPQQHLLAFTDVDWAGCPDDRRSTGGSVRKMKFRS